MNLQAAIDFGRELGLETVEECVDNIKMHALSLFVYEDIERELAELQAEYELHPDYQSSERYLDRCDVCEAGTWHRDGKCLRCELKEAS